MKHGPRVSVLLPYRGASATVEEAIESVLACTLPLELIAVDDGSSDDGPRRVEAMAARDARVIPLATTGLGIPGALRVATAAASAPFLARMDADDVSLPGRLEAELTLLESDDRLGAVGTLVEAFPLGAVGEGMQRYVGWLNSLITPDEHARDLFVESPLCHPSVMIRRRALEAVGGYHDVAWPEDYDLWLRLEAAGFSLAKVPRVLLRWRHREERATFRDPRFSMEQFEAVKAHYLAPRLARMGRPIAIWGAGKTGKRMGRALERNGVRLDLFIDIDPKKIGRAARDSPIVAPSSLEHGRHTIVVAVGARGARALIRAHLDGAGFREGADYVCAA